MTLLTNEDFFVSKGKEIEFIYCLFVETKKSTNKNSDNNYFTDEMGKSELINKH